jgi:hypothetical protein
VTLRTSSDAEALGFLPPHSLSVLAPRVPLRARGRGRAARGATGPGLVVAEAVGGHDEENDELRGTTFSGLGDLDYLGLCWIIHVFLSVYIYILSI